MKRYIIPSVYFLSGCISSLVSFGVASEKSPIPVVESVHLTKVQKSVSIKPAPKAVVNRLSSSKRIDAILASSWKEAGVKPNAPISDDVFLRRVYLDVVGRIPTYKEAIRFMDSKGSGKRAALIDELLASEGYVNHFHNLWADILRFNARAAANQNITPFYAEWVREALRKNMPYDQFVRELITAQGQAWDNGAVGYYTRDRGMPLDHMANTVRIFLGTRLECAQCHDHPFDDWSQMDFFHMAAFTYGVNPSGSNYGMLSTAQRSVREAKDMPEQKRKDLGAAMTEITRAVRNNYSVSHRSSLPKLPHDYRYDDAKPSSLVQPGTMFGADPDEIPWEQRVGVYADWMTSKENSLFTKTISNRLWQKVMGIGLFPAVDQFTAYSEASHPELMAFLEEQMIESGYDMKAFLRVILNSQVYQREATVVDPVPGEIYQFAGPTLRRMTAEQIWDSIVALVNPTPELENWKRDQLFHLRMAEQEAMQKVLGEYDEKDLVKAAGSIAKLQKELKAEEEALRLQIVAAQKASDKKKVSELSREVSQMRTRLRTKVVEMVFHPGMKKSGVETVAMALPGGGAVEVSPMMMDGSGTNSAELRKLQDEAEKLMVEKEMDQLGMSDSKARSQYLSFRRSSMKSMIRAAHLESPAPPGHFLREFGQSDRDTIENANDEASVPQALALLNGTTFSQISNQQSELYRNVAEAQTPESKIDTLFLSLLTRKPTNREKQLLLSHIEERGGSLYQDTTFALLNGQEFWFVQ